MRASNLYSGILYFQYQRVIQTYPDNSRNLSRIFLSDKFSSSRWLYSKNLLGHTGCVNSLALSKHGGEFLVSGGDDTRVLVWKLREAVTGNATARCLKQHHHSNVFSVTFDNDNTHIITGGNDDVIYFHDHETGDVVRCFDAEAETNEICVHPEDDHVFITAESSFGAVTLFDVRTPTEKTIIAVPWPFETKLSQRWPKRTNFSSAKFNPADPTLVATGNLGNGVQLWDIRFPKRCLRHFDSMAGEQCAMSVSFDQTGTYIVAVRKSAPPVLHHIGRDTSLAEFYEKGYSNAVTRKSVCFAGQRDEFIITGSDDFNIYIWKVPKHSKDYPGIAKVDKCSLVLHGHRSIVNQACFNQNTAMICSSGVEKLIKMWSPFPIVEGISGSTGYEKRKLFSRSDYLRLLNESTRENSLEDLTSEDQQMLAMVDQWIQNECSSSDDDSDGSPEALNADQINEDNLNGEIALKREIERSRATSHGSSESDENLETIPEIAWGSSTLRPRLENLGEITSFQNRAASFPEETANDAQRNSVSGYPGNPINNSLSAEGVGLDRLREIISLQNRATSSLQQIAELRKNCLRNEDKSE